MSVRPAKTQISLGICPVWSESSLCTQRVAKDPSFLHVDSEDSDQTSEDSDQTGRMPRLIWLFAGRTLILLVLSCHGSNEQAQVKIGLITYVNSDGLGEPAQSHSLARAFAVRSPKTGN